MTSTWTTLLVTSVGINPKMPTMPFCGFWMAVNMTGQKTKDSSNFFWDSFLG
jgi:hypothetical protein